jgi:hypothetical protein
MSPIAIATQIPSQIDTLEKLYVWAGLALSNINPSLTAIEGVGYTERCAQAGIFYVAADNKYRALIRGSIQVSPDYLAGGAKLWTYAQPLSGSAIPTIFTTN